MHRRSDRISRLGLTLVAMWDTIEQGDLERYATYRALHAGGVVALPR